MQEKQEEYKEQVPSEDDTKHQIISVGESFPQIDPDDDTVYFHIMHNAMYMHHDGEWKFVTFV